MENGKGISGENCGPHGLCMLKGNNNMSYNSKAWLSHYLQPRYVIYNNGRKFKLIFAMQGNQYGIEHMPAIEKKLQANTI